MSAKVKTIIYCLLIANNLSCQKKEKSMVNIQNTKIMNNNIDEKILIKQLEQGANKYIDEAGAELPKIPFDNFELEAATQTVEKILKENGFKELNRDDFNTKVKDIFGRIINPQSENNFLYINYLDKCDKSLVMFNNNDVDYSGSFIDKQRKLITDFYYLPEIVDYQKEYPKLINIENKKIYRKSSIQNQDIEIPHWKDVQNIKEIRKKNIQTIVARNMYLFNDNKAYSSWLVGHDKAFVKTLVKVFGYDKEPKFNELTINDYLSLENNYKIGEIIFSKSCNNQLEIRVEVLESLVSLYKNQSSAKILSPLMNYAQKLLETDEYNIYTSDEKIKMIAHIANTYDYLFKLNHGKQEGWDSRWNILGGYFEDDSRSKLKWKQIKDEIVKNNYYNLPHLKEILNYAEQFDSVGAPD